MQKYDTLIVPIGFRNELPLSQRVCHEIIEVDPMSPMLPQLMAVDTGGKGISIVTPEWADPRLKEHFSKIVGQAWLSLCLTRNTITQRYHSWMDNAFSNYLDFMNATPVCKAGTKGKTKAVICGLGPSLKTAWHILREPPEDTAIFTCWHAAPKITGRIDYLCHLHGDNPGDDYKDYEPQKKSVFIANPTVTPEFLKLRRQNKLLGYYNANFTHVSPFIKKHNITEHHCTNSTVASMMLGAACYMGFKDIALVGIDHAWLDDEDTHETAEADGVETMVNKHGIEIKTSGAFINAAGGLRDFTQLFPETRIVQTTMNAIDITGIDYQPLDEFLNG